MATNNLWSQIAGGKIPVYGDQGRQAAVGSGAGQFATPAQLSKPTGGLGQQATPMAAAQAGGPSIAGLAAPPTPTVPTLNPGQGAAADAASLANIAFPAGATAPPAVSTTVPTGAPVARTFDPTTQTDHLFGGLPGVADASTGGKAAPGNIVDYILGRPAGTTQDTGAKVGRVSGDRSGRSGMGGSATPTTMEGYAPGKSWVPSMGQWMTVDASGRPISV